MILFVNFYYDKHTCTNAQNTIIADVLVPLQIKRDASKHSLVFLSQLFSKLRLSSSCQLSFINDSIFIPLPASQRHRLFPFVSVCTRLYCRQGQIYFSFTCNY